MKDYHDILVMICEPDFLVIDKLASAIQPKFGRRSMPTELLARFDEKRCKVFRYGGVNTLRGLEKLSFPEKMSEVIAEINDWIKTEPELRYEYRIC